MSPAGSEVRNCKNSKPRPSKKTGQLPSYPSGGGSHHRLEKERIYRKIMSLRYRKVTSLPKQWGSDARVPNPNSRLRVGKKRTSPNIGS